MKILQRLFLLALLAGVSLLVIAYARGYRFDIEKKSVTSTGILSLNSFPTAAKVYINDELKGATNTNLTLPPGRYKVEIKKDGYTSWNKEIAVKGELVVTLDALLFPLNPSLSPQTNLGIIKAVPIDQTGKVIVFSQNGNDEKDGIYLFDSSNKPLSFLPPLKPIILKKNITDSQEINFNNVQVYFSPDYKQGIFEFEKNNTESLLKTSKDIKETSAYLFSLDEENKNAFEITNSKKVLLEAWAKEKEKDDLKILETLPKQIVKTASDSFSIISLSPDENKILYRAKNSLVLPLAINPPLIASNQTQEERNLKKDGLYVYDKKEDKNFSLPAENSIQWHPDSKHLIMIEDKKIVAVDYDNTNKQTVYSGPFENYFFITTSDGKIIVLSNLNPEANKYSDLYLVGIK
jgi:hypothetical protein